MKIKSVKLITEEQRNVGGVKFENSTEDQFPYIESAMNSLDENFNWWKENWVEIEQLIAQYLKESLDKNMDRSNIDVESRFTVFHGSDDKSKDVIWTGPAIVYTFEGAQPKIVNDIKRQFGGIYEGHKIFTADNQLIILFG